MKTQHQYSNVREFAMKTLAALILEDYLKFRGTLLVYILAGLLDQQREIKELAVELIMKYTLEKSEIFLRTCLVECPFVLNACPCYGHGTTGLSRSGSILKGQSKRAAREYIYQYIIRKIEPVYLYMYFGNISRLHEFIEKEPAVIAKSSDFQSAIADFFFICTEICTVNEKQKKNLEKIIKESHNGEGIAMNDDDDTVNEQNVGKTDEMEKKGRGGKKNQPTLKQSLSAVEKIVPLISSIDDSLRSMNKTIFVPVLDKFCTNMCMHFESLLEYAQPREFWAPFLKKAKKPPTIATPKQSKKTATKTTEARTAEIMQPPSTPSRAETPKPGRSKSKRRENDSGRFTLEDVEDISSSKPSSSGDSKRRSSNRTITQLSDASISTRSKRSKKRLQSICSQNDSDNESIFSELSDITTASQKRKNTQHTTPGPSNKKAKNLPTTPKTPASRKSSRR